MTSGTEQRKQVTAIVTWVIVLATLAASLRAAGQSVATAQRLAKRSLIVDAHIDAPTELLKHWSDLGVASAKVEFDYPRARRGGLGVAFMAIYTSPEEDAEGTAWQKAKEQIDAVEALAARHPAKFALLRSPAEAKQLRKGGRVLLALGLENGAPLGDDLSQLAAFRARGVSYITLAHSHPNRIADGSYSPKRRWHGLSPFGERVVAEMNRLGIMVDVTHLSDESARAVLALSHAPVIASHTGLRHFTPGFERNLPDDLALAVAKTGGVVQIAFGTPFIDPKAAADTVDYFTALDRLEDEIEKAKARGELPKQTVAQFDAAYEKAHPLPRSRLDQVLGQIDYAVKLLGVDHVGIGSDFDGVFGELPEGLRSVADYPNLIAGLQQRGHRDADIAKIVGGNFMRVWRDIEACAVTNARPRWTGLLKDQPSSGNHSE